MNYRHIYHAGCFADVVKHIILISLMNNLCKKEAPYYALDCFAGIGRYDLSSELALKTKESDAGIKKILSSTIPLPDLLQQYIKLAVQQNKESVTYLGSPAIIDSFLRREDHADFCELHPEDFATLKKNMRNSEESSVHNIDAYTSLKALLPPKQKRGLILIDPAFEVTDEFERIKEGLEIIYKKFSQATTMIWYPIKDYPKVRDFYKALARLKKEILKIEFSLDQANTNLNSTGIIIINPPYIKNILQENLEFLEKKIYSGKADYTVTTLN